VAYHRDQLVGFVSAYLLPQRPGTLFIWQVAIGEIARGQGLAKQMILQLLRQPACAAVTDMETTITESNTTSWALFTSLSRELNASLSSRVCFDQQQHFEGQHDTELLVSVGPISINPNP
jgi:L-2,4-diaminobutyric acid acetyltransferase